MEFASQLSSWGQPIPPRLTFRHQYECGLGLPLFYFVLGKPSSPDLHLSPTGCLAHSTGEWGCNSTAPSPGCQSNTKLFLKHPSGFVQNTLAHACQSNKVGRIYKVTWGDAREANSWDTAKGYHMCLYLVKLMPRESEESSITRICKDICSFYQFLKILSHRNSHVILCESLVLIKPLYGE